MVGSQSNLQIPVMKATTSGHDEQAPFSSGSRGAVNLNLSQPMQMYTPTQSRRGSDRGSVHGSGGGGGVGGEVSFQAANQSGAVTGSARASPAPASVRSNRSQDPGKPPSARYETGPGNGSARASPAPPSVRSNRSQDLGRPPFDGNVTFQSEAKPPSARSNRAQDEAVRRNSRGSIFGAGGTAEKPPSARSNTQNIDEPRRASSKPPTPLSAKNNEPTLSRGGTPLSRAAGDMLEPQEKASSRGSRRPSELSQLSGHLSTGGGGEAPHGTTGMALNDEAPAPPRRTLRRMFADKSEHRNEYNFLRGIEKPPESWQPVSSSRETTFHKGFYRKKVEGQDAERAEAEAMREERAVARAAPRREQLAEHTKHHFLRQDPDARGQGRTHFQSASNIIIAGPESVVPRGPDMEGKRMQGLLREGMAKERTESVRDVFTHMFGYSANDIIRAD